MLELEELDDYLQACLNKKTTTPSLPDTFSVGRSAFVFFFY